MAIAQAFTDLGVSARSQAKLGMHIIYLSSEASARSGLAFTQKACVLFSLLWPFCVYFGLCCVACGSLARVEAGPDRLGLPSRQEV